MRDLFNELEQSPFNFSERQSRSVIKRYGKSNLRRLIQCFEEMGLLGKSWKQVGLKLKHPIHCVPNININVRLEIAAQLCGFKLSTGEEHEIVQFESDTDEVEEFCTGLSKVLTEEFCANLKASIESQFTKEVLTEAIRKELS